jgi:23S rRNA (guanosine2251-2'-O)-methyltransferase
VEEIMNDRNKDFRGGGKRRFGGKGGGFNGPRGPRRFDPSRPRPSAPRPGAGAAPVEDGDLVYGRRPVLDLIRSDGPRRVNKLWVLKGAMGNPVEDILLEARRKGIVFQFADRQRLDQLTGGAQHQGVVARATPFDYATLESVLAGGTPSPLLLLDGIEDPHNLGAIVRNAAFFGAAGVVVPRWRSAGLSGAALKASAGALARVPLVQTANIGQTALELKERGYWIYGADTSGEPCGSFAFNPPFALVIGAEGTGLHRLVKERCDALVSVPGSGGVESLNASCAAGILLYETFRRRAVP